MSISRPVRTAVVAFAASLVVGVPLLNCGLSGSCLRYSDCDTGFTCAEGRCVHPPAPADAAPGEGGALSDASGGALASCNDDAETGACGEASAGDGGGASTADAPVE